MLSLPLSVTVGNITRCEWQIQLPVTCEISSFSLEKKQFGHSVMIHFTVRDKDSESGYRQISPELATPGPFSEPSLLDIDEDPFLFNFPSPHMFG